NPGDDFTGSLPVADDPAGGFPGFLQIGHISGQPAQTRATATHNAREWLVDFMRDRGGQFPQYAYPVDVRQIGLEWAKSGALFFGPLAFRDVPGDMQQEATPAIPKTTRVCFDRKHRAVL